MASRSHRDQWVNMWSVNTSKPGDTIFSALKCYCLTTYSLSQKTDRKGLHRITLSDNGEFQSVYPLPPYLLKSGVLIHCVDTNHITKELVIAEYSIFQWLHTRLTLCCIFLRSRRYVIPISLEIIFPQSCFTVSMLFIHVPDSKAPGVNMGPICGRQGPGGPYVGPMNIDIWNGYQELDPVSV